ncbi:MAG: PA0069 family radical SAM protein [Planctomycetota bacterium]
MADLEALDADALSQLGAEAGTQREPHGQQELPEVLPQLRKRIATEYFDDDSRSIVTENRSPDIPFRYSLNPYRGCSHGCSYCYARPTHEYLGFNAGIDFEAKIVVKRDAAELLRNRLQQRSWCGEPVMMSGVTDCYQPVERELKIARQCLEVAAEFNQPIGIITKNALVTRDLDLIEPMAAKGLCRVAVSVTSLDQSLSRKMEPRTSAPAARIEAIRKLADAGIPVTLMVAPLVPGLTDDEMPAIMEAAREAGARHASYIMLRLPLTVEPVFREWLTSHFPDSQERVLGRIRQVRDGGITIHSSGVACVESGALRII